MQAHNPRIVTNGLIYHLDPTNGGKGGSKILAKPTQISDCTLWLDADDAESVVLSSSNVTNWLDKSGSGNHCSQSTTSKQPVKNGTLNSRSTLTFDGTQYLDNTSMVASSTNMLFIVKKINNVADDFSLFSFVATSNVIDLYYWGANTDQYGFNSWAGDSWGINNFDKEGLFQIDAVLFKNGSPASSGVELYINGATQSLSQVKATSVSRTMSTGYRVGRGDSTTDQEFNGEMAEVIVYARDLSDAERQSIEYYLSRKWAIPLKGRVTTNLADGTNTTISDSGPVEITHSNTFYFPNPDDGNCDLRLEGNEITIADNLPWTMEFWIKRHTRGGARNVYGGVWGNEYGTGEKERLQFTTSGSEDKLVLVDDGNNNASTVITNSVDIDCLHKWRHVVFAFDGTTDATTAGCVRQYVDGQDKGPTIALVNADSKITIKRIGSRGGTSDNNRLEGELGNFRVYDKQLSHAEVLQNYNAQRAKYQNKKMSFAAPDNLKLYLDAQSGTSSNYYADGIWYDLSDQNNDATRANATFTDEGVKYYDFDGTGDYFTISDPGESTTTLSAFVWFKTSDVTPSAEDSLFTHYDYGVNQRSWRLFLLTTGSYPGVWLSANGSSLVQVTAGSSTNIYNDTWHYFGFTFNSGTLVLYVDGVAYSNNIVSGSIPSTLHNSTANVIVGDVLNGGSASGGYDFNGQIANVMLYDTALSADQVTQNYNYFKHRFGK